MTHQPKGKNMIRPYIHPADFLILLQGNIILSFDIPNIIIIYMNSSVRL
jgi:hypothetical protein